MKKIFVINGSASENSSNSKLIEYIAEQTRDFFSMEVFKSLKTLPHFDPDLSSENTPEAILKFRKDVDNADGILICTPEYVFSIPSGLKNAIEWCVSTIVFSEKPTGLITASAGGEKGHEELQLIMKTVMTKTTPATTLLIHGIKGKISQQGEIVDSKTKDDLSKFVDSFKNLIANNSEEAL